MGLAVVTQQAASLPWTDVVYVGAAIVAALGSFIAVPLFFYFLKDRQRVLLRQEVQDEQRRREQLEVRVEELTKQRDADRKSLSDERKKTDVTGIGATLERVAVQLHQVVDTQTKILDKMTSLNGGLDHAAEGLRVTRTAIEFLAQQIVVQSEP